MTWFYQSNSFCINWFRKRTIKISVDFWTLENRCKGSVNSYLVIMLHHTQSKLNDAFQIKQESPPAWTQEAYRLPCSKYSLCYPNWVPPWAGYPPPGYPPARVPPPPGSPQGNPPTRVPPLPPGYPPPRLDLAGYPPGCPMAFWEMLQSIMGYGYPPLWTDRWKDRRVSKHYLPVVLRTRAVKMM